jgi:hypothetical protein
MKVLPKARSLSIVLGAVTALALSPPPASAGATAEEGEAWLDGLYDQVAEKVKAGEPVVIQAHVPLCDNDIIRCGKGKLGDGESIEGNLYWATSGGFRGWFNRKGSGWKQVSVVEMPDPMEGDILEMRVWKKSVKPAAAWKTRGATAAFDVYIVAYAWSGEAIDATLAAYLEDVYGATPRTVTLDDGTVLAAGGAADVVAWVGHNRLMDIDPVDWSALAEAHDTNTTKKGVIAIACHTAAYMAADVPAATRVPMLMTRDFLFAGAHAFEGVVSAFADGGSLAALRKGAIRNYAKGQDKTEKHVGGAFTNPSHNKWPG